jgi:L,D-transpeptidase catalytic domain
MALYKDTPDGSEEPMNRITPRRRPTLVYTFDCITGDKDHPTDKGNFFIFAKDEKHVSHKYSVKMHYAMFFTHDGKAIHQYHGPAPFWLVRGLRQDASDWFGSHGCVRLTELTASLNEVLAAEMPPQQGEELLAFDPHTITELSAQAIGLRLIAHRWNLRSPFYIGAFTRAGIDTCMGGGGLMRVLSSLQSLRTVRILSDVETRQLQDGVSLAVRLHFVAATEIDFGEWTFYLPHPVGARIAVQSEHMERAAELSIGREPFELLKQGCHALGKAAQGR